MKLVDDASNWTKWWSMRFMVLAAMSEALPELITIWSGAETPDALKWVTPVLLTLALVSRVVKQDLGNVQ